MAGDRFQVIDGRNSPWHRADNRIIDDYGAELGPFGLAVYYSYCRHANQNDQCWCSHATTAEETGMSVTSVKKAEKLILKLKLIKKETRRYNSEGPRSNLITLLEIPTLSRQATKAQSPGDQGLRREAATNKNKVEKNKRRSHTTNAPLADLAKRKAVLRGFGLRGSMVTEIAEAHGMTWIRKAMEEMDEPKPGGVIFLHREGWEPPSEEEDDAETSAYWPVCSGCGELEERCGCPDPKPEQVSGPEFERILQCRREHALIGSS